MLASTVACVDRQVTIRDRANEVSESGSHVAVVSNSVTPQETGFERITNPFSHGGVESKDQVSVLNFDLGPSIEEHNHFGEYVVDLDHLSLVEAVGHLHASQEFRLEASPEEFISVGDLGKHFTVVGVVQTEPGVVILKHSQHLSLVQVGRLGAIEGVSVIHVFSVLRRLGQARNEVISPVGHGVSGCRVVWVANDRVLGDVARSPLHQGQLLGGAVSWN